MFNVTLSDNRKIFAAWQLFGLLNIAGASVIIDILGKNFADYQGFFTIGIISSFVVMVLSVIRRLNDLQKSRWMALVLLVPLASKIFYLYLFFARGRTASDLLSERATENAISRHKGPTWGDLSEIKF